MLYLNLKLALFKNEMTRNFLIKCKSYTLEQTLYDIGYEFDNTNGIIDEKQCLEICNLKLKYIHNIEKNLRNHELTQCVRHFLNNHYHINDDTLQYRLDPRRIWNG